MRVIIDKEKWSESSKRSFEYKYSTDKCYQDITYRCVKCAQPSVFTAREQKRAYEVIKDYVGKYIGGKKLCPTCSKNLEALQEKDRQYQKQWEENKEDL